MALKQFFVKIIPKYFLNVLKNLKDYYELSLCTTLRFNTNNLITPHQLSINKVFKSEIIKNQWEEYKSIVKNFQTQMPSGGVNQGDRRALFYLISNFKASRVLEIGTHIGSSTLAITASLDINKKLLDHKPYLTTVDFMDVNSELDRPWERFGSNISPLNLMKKVKHDTLVEFIHKDSIEYMQTTDNKFDFIFLDGDHSANAVYKEVSLALNLLNENGIILLHDYFPDKEPLWSNGKVIPGPFWAIERIKKEGVKIDVMPLGKLPWKTKLDSNITSLCILHQI